MTRWLLIASGALFMIGCSRQPTLSPAAAAGTPEDVAREFASAMGREDWGAAYALTSKHWRAKWTEEGTLSFYQVLARSYEKKMGRPLEVDSVTVRSGELPKDPLDAKERFGITTEPPLETWKAWVISELKTKDGKVAATFPMLIVEEAKSNRVAFVAFKPAP